AAQTTACLAGETAYLATLGRVRMDRQAHDDGLRVFLLDGTTQRSHTLPFIPNLDYPSRNRPILSRRFDRKTDTASAMIHTDHRPCQDFNTRWSRRIVEGGG